MKIHMPRVSQVALFSLVFLTVSKQPISAVADDHSYDSNPVEKSLAIQDGELIKCSDVEGNEIIGSYVRFSNETLFLVVNFKTKTITTESIEMLWATKGKTSKASGIGAGVGALGGMLAAGIWKASTQDSRDTPGGGVYPVLGVMGAGAGAILGILFDDPEQDWKLIYDRNQSSPDPLNTESGSLKFVVSNQANYNTGGLGLKYGYNSIPSPYYDSFIINLSYFIAVTRKFSFGPEIGYTEAKKLFRYYPEYDNRVYSIKKHVFTSALIKYTHGKYQRFHVIGGPTSLITGHSVMGFSVGAGADIVTISGFAINTEFRWYAFLSEHMPDFRCIRAGVDLRW
ncbi:MAG: hypothetical protein KOO62_00990 [candidate division Zixibacteria bacterium]|nr:hypothetical protein [candidate division Zixibacteria bacterium]